MNYLFPLAFMMNTFSMTALMVILGLCGHVSLAADIGIMQGAMTALFFSFSANGRSLILGSSVDRASHTLFWGRVLLIAPLAVASYALGALPVEADMALIVALIVRRCAEWVSEIHLSEMELTENRSFARIYLILQLMTFIVAVAWLLSEQSPPFIGLFPWAVAPLVMSVGFIRNNLKLPILFSDSWRLLLPHYGSTMIIGVTVYVFRLILLFMTGKEVSGELFTAFALGGMVGSVFAQVLGPSVALYEERYKKPFFTERVNVLLVAVLLAGIGLFAFSRLSHLPALLGKSSFFWGALGVSLVGGYVMVYAQHIRYALLQRCGENDLFGPDLLMNLLAIASLPYLYYIVGKDALMFLFMINAILAYLFYRASGRQDTTAAPYLGFIPREWLTCAIPFLILLPVFFRIGSGIFNDVNVVVDSGGTLLGLPLPVSVPAYVAGLLLLGRYRHANVALSFVFVSFVFMLVSSFVATGSHTDDMKAKLFFLLQFVLPMAALVLGQLYEAAAKDSSSLNRTFFAIIMVIVPLQFITTWNHGQFYLYSRILSLFSIYQHLQYVPVIFVGAFLIALCGLWQYGRYRKWLLILIPVMGVYAAASNSVLSLVLMLFGTVLIAVYLSRIYGFNRMLAVAVLFMFLLSPAYLYMARNETTVSQKYGPLVKAEIQHLDVKSLPSVSERAFFWAYHLQGSLRDARVFLFGNSQRPDRHTIMSAHNYYLDLMYNFGVFSLLPILGLICATFYLLYRHRRQVLSSPRLFCLGLVVIFIVLFDNSLKVGLRQPYPGIFTFFLWGILLSKLMSMSAGGTVRPNPHPH